MVRPRIRGGGGARAAIGRRPAPGGRAGRKTWEAGNSGAAHPGILWRRGPAPEGGAGAGQRWTSKVPTKLLPTPAVTPKVPAAEVGRAFAPVAPEAALPKNWPPQLPL